LLPYHWDADRHNFSVYRRTANSKIIPESQ
jgi:hypothetical protein